MKVKIIRREGAASLVEYVDADGATWRKVVNSDSVNGDECDDVAVGVGVDFGADWLEIFGEPDMQQAIVHLHKNGIWDVGDLRKNPLVAQDAMRAATSECVKRALIKLAEFEKSGGN